VTADVHLVQGEEDYLTGARARGGHGCYVRPPSMAKTFPVT
jgi:hypothetical protein